METLMWIWIFFHVAFGFRIFHDFPKNLCRSSSWTSRQCRAVEVLSDDVFYGRAIMKIPRQAGPIDIYTMWGPQDS